MITKFNTKKEKVGCLQFARNKYGPFKIAEKFPTPLVYNKSEFDWSKHVDVLTAWEKEEWWRLERANNRQIFPCEIVLDMDPTSNQTKSQVRNRAKRIYHRLHKLRYTFTCYFSGSRGYHFHLFFPELASYTLYRRKQLREQIIKKFKCDLQKSSDNTMIALEHCPHWKTGNKKVEVKF